jgi:glycogen debranching enzyme
LFEHFARGYLHVHKRSGLHLVRRIFEGFEDNLEKRGLGTISEVFDGNPPHEPRGAISQATAVAALLRVGDMIENCNK